MTTIEDVRMKLGIALGEMRANVEGRTESGDEAYHATLDALIAALEVLGIDFQAEALAFFPQEER